MYMYLCWYFQAGEMCGGGGEFCFVSQKPYEASTEVTAELIAHEEPKYGLMVTTMSTITPGLAIRIMASQTLRLNEGLRQLFIHCEPLRLKVLGKKNEGTPQAELLKKNNQD